MKAITLGERLLVFTISILHVWASVFTGRGAECFNQRARLVRMTPEGATSVSIPTPPKALADKSALGILNALEFESHMDLQ